MVGLGERMDFAPSRLSGGERQRVAIARSLVGRPRLVVADEPTGQLDTESTGRLLDLFERLKRELAFTLVVVTHDPIVAARAGRIVNLLGRRLASALALAGLCTASLGFALMTGGAQYTQAHLHGDLGKAWTARYD